MLSGKVNVLFGVVAAIVLSACASPYSGGGTADPYAPRISAMKIGLEDRTYAKYDGCNNTAYVSFMLYLEDPSRRADVAQVKVIDPKGVTWTIPKAELDAAWEASRNRFALWNYWTDNLDSIDMGDYRVVVSEQGKLDSQYVMCAYNNNNPLENSGKVYSCAVPGTPKYVEKVAGVTASLDRGAKQLTLTATGVSAKYFGMFIWLYNGATYIGCYDVAWPFASTQYPNCTVTQALTAAESAGATNVIVGFLAEKENAKTPGQTMMYRYFCRINF